MRLSVTLACLLFAGVAAADSARVRWRGVATEGRAPAALQAAVQAHVGVALKQLGSSLTTAGAFDVEAAATCGFPSSAKVAHCMVVVARVKGARAERRAEIRYRDADDLAESIALIVSDILTADFADIVGGARNVNPPEAGPPPPVGPPPVGPPPVASPPPVGPSPEEQKAHEAEMRRQLEIVKQLQKQADDARAAREREEAARRQREGAARPAAPKPPPQTRTAVDVGVVGVFGLGSANPTLVGGAVRAIHSRGLLRAGASLSLSGMRQTLEAHDLSFLRALVAARAGIGFRGALVDFDLTGGPALLVLVEDAHGEGRHAVASFAVAVGPRLAIALAGPVALVAGGDIAVAVTDEKVTSGGARIAQFSRASVELTLGIAWRTR